MANAKAIRRGCIRYGSIIAALVFLAVVFLVVYLSVSNLINNSELHAWLAKPMAEMSIGEIVLLILVVLFIFGH